MKNIGAILVLCLLPFCALAQNNTPVNSTAGQVVWWGKNYFWKKTLSTNTNGLVENGNEFLDDAVAVTAIAGVGLALKSDNTVFPFGLSAWQGVTDVPPGLSNVVSITSVGGSFWAIKRDGTVANWGNWEKNDQNKANIVAALSNVTTIALGANQKYLALMNDGMVLEFSFDNTGSWSSLPSIRPVRVQGQVLSNVAAIASFGRTPLVLKQDGTALNFGGDDSLNPVTISGQVLSNVVAVAGGFQHALALKRDGTVVSWGNETVLPDGLSNVSAIAACGNQNLALKRDGTVVAWGGDNHYGENYVPAGLSNVVAIAAGGDFSLAVITGSPPASVFVQPHGRIEAMTANADLVFKGQALSSVVITNLAFRVRAEVEATQFRIISVLKGTVQTNLVTFQHYSSSFRGGWSGREPPAFYRFEIGKPYLIFAAKLDKPDIYYDPTLNTNFVGSNDFRQLYDGGFIRTLDARPLNGLSIKEAVSFEQKLILDNNPTNPTNQLPVQK